MSGRTHSRDARNTIPRFAAAGRTGMRRVVQQMDLHHARLR